MAIIRVRNPQPRHEEKREDDNTLFAPDFHPAALVVALETYGDLISEIGCQICQCRA